jgi:hypothetical protein
MEKSNHARTLSSAFLLSLVSSGLASEETVYEEVVNTCEGFIGEPGFQFTGQSFNLKLASEDSAVVKYGPIPAQVIVPLGYRFNVSGIGVGLQFFGAATGFGSDIEVSNKTPATTIPFISGSVSNLKGGAIGTQRAGAVFTAGGDFNESISIEGFFGATRNFAGKVNAIHVEAGFGGSWAFLDGGVKVGLLGSFSKAVTETAEVTLGSKTNPSGAAVNITEAEAKTALDKVIVDSISAIGIFFPINASLLLS